VTETTQLVMFVLDDQKYALRLDEVERVTRVVEVTPLPDAPPVIRGVVNVQGTPAPVVDLRKRFRKATRDIAITDHLIVARSSTGLVALPVDEALGLLRDTSGEIVPAAEVVPDLNYVSHVLLLGPDMVFVLDVDTVLTDDEEASLADSLGAKGEPS